MAGPVTAHGSVRDSRRGRRAGGVGLGRPGPQHRSTSWTGHSAHVFDEFAAKLTGTGRVYGITRRGWGASSQPSIGYENQRLADDVLEVLNALKLDRVVLVGHSAAGHEITTLARQHPDRV